MQTDTSNLLRDVFKGTLHCCEKRCDVAADPNTATKTRWLAAPCPAASAYLTGARGKERKKRRKKPVALSVCSSSLPLTLVLRLPIRAEDEGREGSLLLFFFFLALTHPPSRVQSRWEESAYEYVVSKSEKWRRDIQLPPAARRTL